MRLTNFAAPGVKLASWGEALRVEVPALKSSDRWSSCLDQRLCFRREASSLYNQPRCPSNGRRHQQTAMSHLSDLRNGRLGIPVDAGIAIGVLGALRSLVHYRVSRMQIFKNIPGHKIDQNIVRSDLFFPYGGHHPFRVSVHVFHAGPDKILRLESVVIWFCGFKQLTRIIFVNNQVDARRTGRGVAGRILFTVRAHHVGTV